MPADRRVATRRDRSTLKTILAAREARRATIDAAVGRLTATDSASIFSIGVNVPGPDKLPLWATKVAARGCAALEGYLRVEEVRSGVVWISWCDTAAGPERIAVVGLPTAEAKRAAIAIEDADPIGRLLDIDVYDSTGRSVSRYDLSLPPRRCLICDRPAHECARSRRHSLLELQRQIAKLLSAEAV